jgi:WD40 repeat protein
LLALALLSPRAGPAAGKAVTTLKGHKHTITCLTYAPDGKTLATGGIDRNVTLWDVAAVLEKHRR